MKRKIYYLIGIFTLGLTLFACKKEELKGIEKEQKRLMGIWKVNTYSDVKTDTLTGKVLQTTTLNDVGTIEFTPGEAESQTEFADGFFPEVRFHSTIATLQPCQYFRGLNAGDAISDGWVINWEADPESKRLLFWASGPLSSYHRILTLETTSANSQKLTLVTADSYNTALLHFITLEMTKQ